MSMLFVNKFFSKFTVTVSLAVTASTGDTSEESLAESLVPDHPSVRGGIEE